MADRTHDEGPADRRAADGTAADEPAAAECAAADPDADRAPSGSAAREAAQGRALDAMTELLREDARNWARQLRLLQELDDLAALGARAGVAQFPQLEMAGSWNVGQLTATRWMWEAERFAVALPGTLRLLERGELLAHQARVLLHRTRHCPVEVARAVEAQVLPGGASLCPSDLARRVERVLLRVEAEQAAADPAAADAAAQRQAEAVAQRRTFAKPLPDAMGLAGAVLTAEQMVGWQCGMDALERRERLADRQAGVERTAAQRHADLFAALPAMVLAGTAQDRAQDRAQSRAGQDVPARGQDGAGPADAGPAPDSDGGGAGAPAAPLVPWTLGPERLAAEIVINVHVPVSAVLDLSHEPGTLDRYGPVSAEHVRLLRPRSWRRVMVDADSGRPIAVDDRPTPAADPASEPEQAPAQVRAMLRPDVVVDADEPQHDPSARLARLVDLRDVHCCGPGCSMTVTHRDHLIPYPQGPTSARNLGRASARCHRAKHAGWTLERHPDGSVTWTSPLGRVYHRPSPHAPSPRVDLHADPPARRPRPTLPAPTDTDLRPDHLVPRGEARTDDAASDDRGVAPRQTVAGDDLDDEPPPF